MNKQGYATAGKVCEIITENCGASLENARIDNACSGRCVDKRLGEKLLKIWILGEIFDLRA